MPVRLAPFLAILSLVGRMSASDDLLHRESRVAAAAEPEARIWGARVDALQAQGALRLASVQPDGDFAGRWHRRYEQCVDGVRVFGAQLVRQVDERGETLTVFGRLQEGIALDTVPTSTPDQAVRVAEADRGRGARAVGEPELVLLPLARHPALTWMLWVRFDYHLDRYFVDAHTGEVAWRYEDQPTVSAVGLGTGVWGDKKKVSADAVGGSFRADDKLRPPSLTTYDLKFNLGAAGLFLGTAIIDPSFVATSPNNTWTDGGVVDAHAYAGWTYDYYFKRHNRRGIDGHDLPIRSITHLLSPASDFANSFWDPFTNSMFYGDGNQTYGVFSGAQDVVAHEMTHGVTQYSWAGIYVGETAALNEAFSDIMGTSVEFYQQPPGNGRLLADYFLGEDLAFQFDPPRTAVRSMENPSQFCNPQTGCDADHYSRLYHGPADSGGAHHNNGVINHAFYLLIEGGVNRTSGIRVGGLGSANRERAEKIFYRGFTAYLTPTATFADARVATLRAAADLYGPSSLEAFQVALTWTAVGVN
jgi:Zn-dependent metalloprotease